MLRSAMFGFVAAALVTLFDQGTLWQFTLDPGRRLAVAAYWMGHAAILGTILLRFRALGRTEVTTLRAFAEFAVIGLLVSVLAGLIIADGQTLIEVALTNAAPGAFLIIVTAFLLRMFWRMFADAEASPLVPVDETTGEAKWRDVLVAIAMAPLAMLFLVAWVTLFGVTWRSGTLFLDYAVQAQAWAQLDWKQPMEYVHSRFEALTIYIVLSAILIVWIVLEKLFVRPQKPIGETTNSPQ